MTAEQTARLERLTSQSRYSEDDINEYWELADQKLKEDIDGGTKRWGNWRYTSNPPTLDHKYDYPIALSRITTARRLGDWLMNLEEEDWIKAEDLGNLVKALSDLERIGLHKTERAKFVE